METKEKPAILFVDDEQNILEAYRRTLRKHYHVLCANSGKEALAILSENKAIPVIVSDMQMPSMNGIELLLLVKEKHPQTVRVMLTGNADQETAVNAINTSDVFCFLNKPCSPEDMMRSLKSALIQYELVTIEQQLMAKTVRGCIKTLVEILSIVRPALFGRVSLIRKYMVQCAKKLNIKPLWEIEAIALLSHIGFTAVPENILDKALNGMPITDDEKPIYYKHAEASAQLISNIPRLEKIAHAVRYQHKGFDGSGNPQDDITGNDIPIGARLLRAVTDLVEGEQSGLSCQESLAKMKNHEAQYDPKIFAALIALFETSTPVKIKEVAISQLAPGMQTANNVVTQSGTLLVSKGQEISESLIVRLTNFWQNKEISEKIHVVVHV